MREVIIIAAENGSLPGGKVGGVGDVVRDLPPAIAAEGWRPTVLTPSYGKFHELPDMRELASVGVGFRGVEHPVRVHERPDPGTGVRTVVFEHDLMTPTEPGLVYHNDAADRPYATDASKFAFFCAAAATWIDRLPDPPDAVHLHDWHSAYYLLLRDYSELAPGLRDIHTVFTIHNLAYQGQRPLAGDDSALETWFPDMDYDPDAVRDPGAADAINPMAMAIRGANLINTVSPTYAQEICMPSDAERGFIGGEGLEDDLSHAAHEGRLSGILNGCDYSGPIGRRPGWQQLLSIARRTATGWSERDPADTMHGLALKRLDALPKRRPLFVLTSVGRIVAQKMQLFLQVLSDGRTALEHILDRIDNKGVVFLLGSGEALYEKQLERIAMRSERLVFLRGYSEAFGDALYRAGDLFLMPSSFEPCGISQMLAMRAGQPCVVHGVGGLRDTVEDSVSGFVFDGTTPVLQAANFVASVGRALQTRRDHPVKWQAMQKQAAKQRFDWSATARQYIENLYEHSRP